MKAILFFILVFLSTQGFSQISTQISFDQKDKTITLKLKNETEKLYRLSPRPLQEYIPGTSSFFIFEYKNKNNEVLYTRKRFIFEDQPITEYHKKQLLVENQENIYTYNLSKWYKGDVYMIDIYIQIEAQIIGTNDTLKQEIKKRYLWK